MRLKILTFNIFAEQYSLIDDKKEYNKYYKGIPTKEMLIKRRWQTITKQIKKANADVVILEEVTHADQKDLTEEFDDYHVMPLGTHKKCGKDLVGNESPTGNLTMLKKATGEWTALKHTTKYLYRPSNNGSSITTGKLNGQPFAVIGIHFEWDKEPIRVLEAKAHATLVAGLLKKKFWVIMAGDFNTDKATTHNELKELESAVKKATSTYLCEAPMIDYIYVGGHKRVAGKVLNDKAIKKSHCEVKTLREYGSDHYPVVAVATF